MERFMQEGVGSARHVATIIGEYDLEVSGGAVRWAIRRAMEEQSAWSAARCRFRELGSMEAWSMVAEAGIRQVKAAIEDSRWEATRPWQTEDRRMELVKEAKRLEKNLQRLQKHVPLLQGAPDVQDLQAAMHQLSQVEGAAGASTSGAWATTAVAFLSRDLQEPVQAPWLEQ